MAAAVEAADGEGRVLVEVVGQDDRVDVVSEETVEIGVSAHAESGGRGIVGLEPTISAVREGRVHIFAIAEGATAEGWECHSCDYFTSETLDRCPLCSSDGKAIPDVIERAMEKAYLNGARVEIVFGEAREWLLARGGLGAVLRY